jgi:hypothetical protein
MRRGSYLPMGGDITYEIEVCYDKGRRHWRWTCDHPDCGRTEHPTTAIEPGYSGPAVTAAMTHADQVHPGDEVKIAERPEA